MNYPWFKFYGGEYLSDSKMTALSAADRSCWLTLLCYASQDQGRVRHLTETVLMVQSGVKPETEEWERTKGVIERLVSLEMIQDDNGVITLKNWKKRQESYLTGYERLKRYRERQKEDGNDNVDDNAMITLDIDKEEDIDIDKEREKKKTPAHATLEYLRNVPKADLKEFSDRFGVSTKEIESKAEDLLLYCERKKKRYANYRSFLLNACKRDFTKQPEKRTSKYDGIKKTVVKQKL